MDRRVLVKDDARGRLLSLHLEQSGDAPCLITHAHAFDLATAVFASSENCVRCDLPVPSARYGASELLAAAFVDDDGLGMHMLFLVLFLHARGHVALVRVSPDLSAVDDLTLLEVAAWHNHRCHARLVDGPRVLLYSSSSKAMQLLAWNSDEGGGGGLQPITGEIALPAATLGMPQCQRVGTHLLLHAVLPDDVHAWDTLPLWPLSSVKKRAKRDEPDLAPCTYLSAPTTAISSVYISSQDTPPTTLFVGTMAPSLVAYRYGCVVASLQLPGPAIDIQHAAVDAGLGVLAVLCNDAQQTLLVVSVHDDALTIVQEIALVDRVLVADFKGNGRDQLLCLSEQSVDDILGRWLLTDLSYVHTNPAKDKKVKKRRAKTKLHVRLDKMMPPDRSGKLLAIEQAMLHKAAHATADNTRLGRFMDEKKRLVELLYQHCSQTVHAQATPALNAPESVELLALETVLPAETTRAPAAVVTMSSLRQPCPWTLKHWAPVAVHHTPTSMVVDVALTVVHRAADALTDVTLHAVSSSSLTSVSTLQPVVPPGAECSVLLQLTLSQGALEIACDLCIAYTDVRGVKSLFQPLAPLAIGTTDLLRLPATVPRPDIVTDLILVSPRIDLTQAVPGLQAVMPERIDVQLLRPSIASLSLQSHSLLKAQLMRAHVTRALDGCTVLTSPFSRTHMDVLQTCMRGLRKELALLQGSASVNELRTAQIQLDVAMGHLHKAVAERAETSVEAPVSDTR
ncbi:hypothetical protein SPRG_05024 [Saprolegnia parasitica CBS 223.65]|uniref:Uncharacterized protein n=1 Tax=Saprolegnia parasitica (strain CBS 223.65) TaxID=695850 RepID=A0A067CII1_SAPPC|nr:hypothetical protein SPRG_05024 [Saprolegnia parasitica CBS 223.65]KDO30313.1 hypothetical protein SPRG_05024 [Saprolegnia parasitica CBS 223.65]|eukprot:XP_012198923.1 hypothetical protein SPRG_05024 [Saprolegnia parasitica CBS 223.65]